MSHHFEDAYLDSTILLVDDEPANVRLLERILQREGFRHIESTQDPREFLDLCDVLDPDILLLDLHMPGLDGFGVMERLAERFPDPEFVPILVLTADITHASRQRALRAGAKDFLTKPVEPTEVVLRIKNLLQTRFYYRQLQDQNETLERKVRERTHELELAQIEILERLARAAEYRDDETGHHAQRVGHTSAMLGRKLGLSETEVLLLRRAAPLHDVGKIGIPDAILLKPGQLTDEEFAQMKKHTSIGAGILAGSRFPVLQLAEQIALYHHENWDGSGYMRLERDGVPVPAQIVHVADVFDALTHRRPYKDARPVPEALEEIQEYSGSHFNPEIVAAILSLDAEERLEVQGPPPRHEALFDDRAASRATRPRPQEEDIESVASA
ncbi:MAG: response regulator [Gemmatimonadota bacterium]